MKYSIRTFLFILIAAIIIAAFFPTSFLTGALLLGGCIFLIAREKSWKLALLYCCLIVATIEISMALRGFSNTPSGELLRINLWCGIAGFVVGWAIRRFSRVTKKPEPHQESSATPLESPKSGKASDVSKTKVRWDEEKHSWGVLDEQERGFIDHFIQGVMTNVDFVGFPLYLLNCPQDNGQLMGELKTTKDGAILTRDGLDMMSVVYDKNHHVFHNINDRQEIVYYAAHISLYSEGGMLACGVNPPDQPPLSPFH